MTEPRTLTGRLALVTGGTGGLGLALAEGLAGAGADLLLTGLEEEAAFASTAAAVAQSHGVRVDYRRADLARPEAIEALIAQAEGAGGVDILVNNAVVRSFAPIEALSPADWDQALAVNLSAAFHATRLCLPGMKRRRYGRIFNMASVYGVRGTADRVGYVVTKAAIEGLTRATALECLDGDVTCHALRPGSVLTPGTDGRVRAMMAADGLSRPAAERAFLQGKQPTGRFVAPDTVVSLMLLLCGPAGRDMTGATLPVDGGWTVSD